MLLCNGSRPVDVPLRCLSHSNLVIFQLMATGPGQRQWSEEVDFMAHNSFSQRGNQSIEMILMSYMIILRKPFGPTYWPTSQVSYPMYVVHFE